MDEEKNEARLILENIPLWKVKSTDHIGFDQFDTQIESQMDKRVIRNPQFVMHNFEDLKKSVVTSK